MDVKKKDTSKRFRYIGSLLYCPGGALICAFLLSDLPDAGCGPGYATPKEAFLKGPREKLLYIPTIEPNKKKPDYLGTM